MARTTSSTPERSAFSTEISLSAQVPPTTAPPSSRTATSMASRSSTEYSQFSMACSISSTASGSVSARKPTRPEVDAHERGVGVAGQLRRPEERAVTTEDHDDLGALGGVGIGRHDARRPGCRGRLGLVLQDADADAAGQHPGRRCAGQLDDVPPAGVGGQQHAAVLPPAPRSWSPSGSLTAVLPRLLGVRPPPAPDRHRAAARGRTPRSRRGRAAGSPPRPLFPTRGPGGLPATCRTASTRCSGSRTTPPAPRRSRPTSNWGLTIGNRSASSAAQAVRAGRTSPAR